MGGERDSGWDSWMASPTQWAWVRVNSGSWWWTGRPGVLQSMESQSRTWLSDWPELNLPYLLSDCPTFCSIKNSLSWEFLFGLVGLGLRAFTAMAWVQSLVRELRSCKPFPPFHPLNAQVGLWVFFSLLPHASPQQDRISVQFYHSTLIHFVIIYLDSLLLISDSLLWQKLSQPFGITKA